MYSEERLRLSGAENTGRESGGLMSSINGLRMFYFLPELYDVDAKLSVYVVFGAHCRVMLITYICILTMNLWI